MSRLRYTLFVVFLAFISITCKKEDLKTNDDTNPDNTGNLYISNRTSIDLALYVDGIFSKTIPAQAANFLVNIKNSQGLARDLKLWKSQDVMGVSTPLENTLFRRWVVILPTSDAENKRISWIIAEGEQSATGIVEFSYPLTDVNGQKNIYSVDIFLDSKTGSKVASLAPGDTRQVGVPYGLRYIYYKYWYSSNNSTSGVQEIGEYPSNPNENITVVINSDYELRYLSVPVFRNSLTGRNGIIKVYNNTSSILQIMANGAPIEQIAIINGSSQGYSILQPNDRKNITVPENDYTFSAVEINNNTTINQISNISIVEAYDFSWNIGDNITYTTISVANNLNDLLTIHDSADNYLGYNLKPHQTSSIKIDSRLKRIVAKNYFLNDYFAIKNPITPSWEINQYSNNNLPTVLTNSIDIGLVTQTTALCSGTVLMEGGTLVTQRGTCWSEQDPPMITDEKTIDGSGDGTFYSSLTNLVSQKKYYVRAYATNSFGTSYGEVKSFTVNDAIYQYSAVNEANKTYYLNDEFDDNQNSWYTGDKTEYKAEITAGIYRITIKDPDNGYYFYRTNTGFDYTKDFQIESTFKMILPADVNNCGLWFGLTDNSNYYSFRISKDKFKIFSCKNTIKDLWFDWTSSPYIHSDGFNKISIRKTGNKYLFFINEIFICEHVYEDWFENKTAFIADQSSTMEIQNIQISYLSY